MKESTNIANRFSDAYIVAMIEGNNAAEVLGRYETAYPELTEVFRTNAKDLELLYGHIRKSELPSEEAIAKAYAKFRKLTTPALASEPKRSFASTFASAVTGFFTQRPALAGASFGLGLAVLLALFMQPWQQPASSVASGDKSPAPQVEQKPVIPEIAEGPKTTIDNPTSMPEPAFRGGQQEQDKGKLDKSDRSHLNMLSVDNSLLAPTGLKVIGVSDSVVVVHWNSVKNALSYIVEVKRANEGEFKAVSQTSQTQARISGLPSSERVELRVIAASGDRKGEASAAKSITIP